MSNQSRFPDFLTLRNHLWWTRKKSEASTAGKIRMLRTPCIERNKGVEWFDDP